MCNQAGSCFRLSKSICIWNMGKDIKDISLCHAKKRNFAMLKMLEKTQFKIYVCVCENVFLSGSFLRVFEEE